MTSVPKTDAGVDRRFIDWTKIRGPKNWSALLIATWFGAGLLPKMPGTWGTIAALPIAYWTNPWPVAVRLVFWAFLLALGTWSGKRMYELTGVADNQNIVVDEVVGLGITAWTCGQSWFLLLVAFVLFRFFDVVKIPPVRAVDLWSKNGSGAWKTGFGVMADDVVAGFQGLLVIWLLQHFHVLPLGTVSGVH